MTIVELTTNEINILCSLLRDSAQDKKRRARKVHANDRADMEASAMRDYDVRKKLIGAKTQPHPYTPVLNRLQHMIAFDQDQEVAHHVGIEERYVRLLNSIKDFATFLENYMEQGQ